MLKANVVKIDDRHTLGTQFKVIEDRNTDDLSREIPNESEERQHLRHRRVVPFRPLFVYRQEQKNSRENEFRRRQGNPSSQENHHHSHTAAKGQRHTAFDLS